jgi:hypothetical protein
MIEKAESQESAKKKSADPRMDRRYLAKLSEVVYAATSRLMVSFLLILRWFSPFSLLTRT